MSQLEALLQRLVKHDVEFVVVGASASMMHGVTLVVRTVEICCPFTLRNLRRLHDAIADLHPVDRYTCVPFRVTRERRKGLEILTLETDLGALNCFISVDHPGMRKRSVVMNLDFGKCRVLGLDTLIQAKRAMDRPRDRETVKQLEAIRAKKRRGV